MSLLVNTVQPSPGQYYFAASGSTGGGGGGGDVVATTLTVEPVNAPAGGAVAPVLTIAASGPPITLWEEGLVNQATGTPVNSGNDLTFVGYSDAGVALAPPITFQRSNGSVIANNVQTKGYVYLPTGGGTIPNNPVVIGGSIAPGVTTYPLPSTQNTFTPLDTGLYSVEFECSVITSGSGQLIVPPPAYFLATLLDSTSTLGGSIVVKPWYTPFTSDGGNQYLTTQANTFELVAGTQYTLTVKAVNPNQSSTTPGVGAGLFGMFGADGTTPAGASARINLFVNVISMCRVNTPIAA